MTRTLVPLLPILLGVTAVSAQIEDVQFNRDVRPILADKCFKCHGPDAGARKAKLRLDNREGVLSTRKNGRVVVPGEAKDSLLIRRIHHEDPGERMPPAKSGKTLTAAERNTLSAWIDSGATWQDHWSFEPLRQPAVPKTDGDPSMNNPIDRFLSARLAKIGIRAAAPADPRTLIRRLYLDLVGLPPPVDRVDSFEKDPSVRDFEKIVDELLASEAHAERLTMYWLDLVRYADSSGIHGDQVISMSPFRDYVIRSFHANKPFDVFTREQLAGDLLPGATLGQKVASGYNRLNMKTAEGGAQPAEYLAKYAADRVRTTATVWLGSTLGCAECHDHKFDPFSTKDFYRFAAFFADLEHRGLYAGANSTGDWGPKVVVPTARHEREVNLLREDIAKLERELGRSTPELESARRDWERKTRAALAKSRPPRLGPWRSAGPFRASSVRDAHRKAFGPERAVGNAAGTSAGTSAGNSELGAEIRWEERPTWRDGVVHKLTGGNCATYLFRTIDSEVEQRTQLSLGSDDSIKVWLNGELVLDHFVTRGAKPGQEKPTVALKAGRNELLVKICNGGGGYGFYFQIARSGPPAPIVDILRVAEGERSAKQHDVVAAHFRSLAPALAGTRKRLAAARKQLTDLEKDLPTTLVSLARKTPRETRVLLRGNWMDKSGEVVTSGVPAFLARNEIDGERSSRLDLAAWMTSKNNPLTARVFVNRLWKLYFGRGLCSTLDDVGSQGAWPRNLELLDWLAAEFRRDWNVRRIIRLIVTSTAYKQSSTASGTAMRRDPENLEFARQGRFRHDAEIVRDYALAVSGLLNRTVGGPSVKPYQPAGHWAQLNFPRRKWVHDDDANQYRRGLYTHWQRTFLHPSMRGFDAPTREECTAERPMSNTPLQALILLNDPTYVEAARAFAASLLQGGGDTFESRVRTAFSRVLARAPSADELSALRTLWKKEHARFTADPEAARELTTVGLAPQAEGIDVIDHAAWTSIARAMFNLHETITRY